MTNDEAKALYRAGKIRGIYEELRQELRALDWAALQSYLLHPAPDFAYGETCYLVAQLARELQMAPEGVTLAELLKRYPLSNEEQGTKRQREMGLRSDT